MCIQCNASSDGVRDVVHRPKRQVLPIENLRHVPACPSKPSRKLGTADVAGANEPVKQRHHLLDQALVFLLPLVLVRDVLS